MKLNIDKISKDYGKKNIVVIGDIILDAYIFGKVNRISQEAPVPIVSIDDYIYKPGGAANVALNLSNLGVSVTLIGITGNDVNSSKLIQEIENNKNIDAVIFEHKDRPTSVKTRIIADGRQIARLDDEIVELIKDYISKIIKDSFDEAINQADGVIIQDYNKGLMTKSLINHIMKTSQNENVPVYIDPKYDNYENYRGARLFKPNLKEFQNIAKDLNFDKLPDSGFKFKDFIDSDLLLLTLGSDGMVLYNQDNVTSIPTKARKVYDVSGAGDTVIATFAINDICGLDPNESSLIANLAAGRVCEEVGVFPINLNALKEILYHYQNSK